VRFERANLLSRPRKGKSQRDHPPAPGGRPPKPRTFRGNLPQIVWGSGILVPCPAPSCSLRLNRQDFALDRAQGPGGFGREKYPGIPVLNQGQMAGERRGSGEQNEGISS